MPAHSSTHFQPLDVSIFASLERAYWSLVEAKMQQGFYHIDNIGFIEIYHRAHEEAFALGNIISALRATGLILFNLEEALDHFTI